ncbi:MAG: repeat-containing protein [Cyanobacteria bacterium RYN_339]|nr:repeat-containing protein [Cyanobacteria bacterium RYN_339]
MLTPIHRWVLPTLALALVACTTPPATTVARRPSEAPSAPAKTPPPAVVAIASARPPQAAPHTLSGIVQAPVGLVAEKGNGVVSNNGGSILGKMKRGLLDAPAQGVVTGARVAVLDAAGKPVAGPGGQPLVATTDDQGAYAFDQPLPADNLVVSVELGVAVGQLTAIAPASTSERRVDLDVVSTLTTGYILDRYVSSQADPIGTLDRLPAGVEADTRAKAAAAVAGGKVALPDALTRVRVVAAIDALRKADPALDAQLDTVKRLLIPAGQSDLGAGLLATTVALGRVEGLAMLPSGELLLATVRVPAGGATTKQARLWRLGADGRLAVAIDDHNPYVSATGPDGAPAFGGFGVDAAGRTLINAGGRLGRIEADGTVTPVAELTGVVSQVRVDAQGRIWTINGASTNGPQTIRVTSIAAAGASPQPRKALPGAAGNSVIVLAVDGHATVFDPVTGKRNSYDPATDAWTSAAYVADPGGWTVDAAGNAFIINASTRAVSAVQPDGSARRLVDALPPEVQLSPYGNTIDLADLELSNIAVCAAPDGSAYMVDYQGRVYHLVGGKATLVAGVAAAAIATGDANAISLEQPSALAALPNGDMLVADARRKQILRVTPDHRIAVYGGSGQDGMAAEGQAIAAAPLSGVQRMLAGSNGDLYVLQQSLISLAAPAAGGQPGFGFSKLQLLRLGADGVVHIATHSDTAFPSMNAFVLAGDVPYFCSPLTSVQRVTSQGLEPVDLGTYGLGGAAGGTGAGLVAGDAKGTLWLALEPKTLLRCVPPAKPEVVSTDARVAALIDATTHDLGRGVVDAQGRLCFADAVKGCVWRLDPKTTSFTCIAGQGGPIFAGTTPDDSLSSPKDLAFAPDGALLVLDGGSKQLKRIPPDKL